MIDTQTIKELADLRTVLSFYGIEPDYHGFIPCFAHKEKTASMKIYKNNTCHCFGCGADFDIIGAVQEIENIPFRTACERVCAICGLPLDKESTPSNKATIAAKLQAIRHQKAEERRRVQERGRKWRQLCKELRHAETVYRAITPYPNTPEFAEFQNDARRVENSFFMAAKIERINNALDKLWAQS